jgi:hypothetical protein
MPRWCPGRFATFHLIRPHDNYFFSAFLRVKGDCHFYATWFCDELSLFSYASHTRRRVNPVTVGRDSASGRAECGDENGAGPTPPAVVWTPPTVPQAGLGRKAPGTILSMAAGNLEAASGMEHHQSSVALLSALLSNLERNQGLAEVM